MEKIVIIDDDESITRQVAIVVESMGFQALPFTDPLKAVEETDFDVVITDFMMPEMNGIELLGVFKQKNPQAVRLLLTAANGFKVAMEAVNRGEVFRLLAKPWQLAELRAVIEQAVNHARLVKENLLLTATLTNRNFELAALNDSLESLVKERTTGLLEGMVRALDYRDTETQWHSRRVALFTRRIAQEAGAKGADLVVIEEGALLHDIGKIGVRDSILLKPGPLTPEEWVEMKQHPEIGYRMLSTISYLHEAAKIVYQHQERWDGKGYPQGLKGEDIVFGARCFCIADTFDAMTSDRPYRKGMSQEAAIAEISRIGGTQLDPNLVKAFLDVPIEDWNNIRSAIDALEDEDRRRWHGKPLITPASALLGDWKKRSDSPA